MRKEELYFNDLPVSGFDELVGFYRRTEFESPWRSTVPLLALIRDGWPTLQRLLVACGMQENTRLHVEWQVKPTKGKGKASHTDVMAKGNGATLAIEFKWTEPRYKTVAEWLGKDGGSVNKRAVLEGWLDLLRPHAKKDLRAEAFSGVVYQMLHRAASACIDSPFDPYFLAAFLLCKFGQLQLARHRRGTAQGGLILKDVFKIKAPHFSDDAQLEVRELLTQAISARRSSHAGYTEVQRVLESQLRLDLLKFGNPKGYAARFSVIGLHESAGANRMDAQCFAPQAVALNHALARHGKSVPLASLLKPSAKGRQQDEVKAGAVDYCSIKHITSREVVEASRASPPAGTPFAEPNDLLLAITGATIGKVGIVKRYRQLAFSGDLLRLRSRGDVDPHYLLAALDHRLGQIQFNRWITGSTNGHLAPRDVGRVLVPRLEPKVEQRIAELVEDSLAKRQESEALLDRAKRCVEELIDEAVRK
jgi:hypothetical protein